MLSDDSILRRLPAPLDPVKRVRFEAMAFASDALELAMTGIKNIALKYGGEGHSMSVQDRSALFAHAWSAVDQLHALRQLFRSFSDVELGPTQRSFVIAAAISTSMRNCMDHLSTNLKNLSNQRGAREPLFGVVSYLCLDDIQPDERHAHGAATGAGWLTSVSAGSVPDRKFQLLHEDPVSRSIHPPVSHITLSAFGKNLHLTELAIDALELMRGLSNRLEKLLHDEAKGLSENSGTKAEELLMPLGLTGIAISARVLFCKDQFKAETRSPSAEDAER